MSAYERCQRVRQRHPQTSSVALQSNCHLPQLGFRPHGFLTQYAFDQFRRPDAACVPATSDARGVPRAVAGRHAETGSEEKRNSERIFQRQRLPGHRDFGPLAREDEDRLEEECREESTPRAYGIVPDRTTLPQRAQQGGESRAGQERQRHCQQIDDERHTTRPTCNMWRRLTRALSCKHILLGVAI